MLKHSFVVWNNKGGVGKSTIVFNIAAHYAAKHPNENVLVVDMCPQANATMMLLGGGHGGEDNLLSLQSQANPLTIVGFITDQIDAQSSPQGHPRTYHVKVDQYNSNMPQNLWLIAGDGNLELMAPAISYYANAQFPTDAWRRVHLWLRNLVQTITSGPKPWVVFVDTNPAFGVYTELAILAGDRLLIPYKADDSSRLAVRALFHLLWGAQPAHPVYGRYTFARKADEEQLERPLCHLFIGNQFKQYAGTAAAFRAMSAAVVAELHELFKKAPNRYTSNGVHTAKEFFDRFIVELRDFNTTGVVAAHKGKLISDLQEGENTIHGEPIVLDAGRIQSARDAIDEVLAALGD